MTEGRPSGPPGPPPSGVVVVDKPAGWTSHDVVAKSRAILGTRKVGHSGTLDPDATGVLVLGVGRATRLLRFVTALPKSYETEIVLGVETDTLDASGTVTAHHDMSSVTVSDVRTAAAALTGDLMQTPPMVSAVKIGGRRLHELARAGVEVDRPARPVTVRRFDVEPVGMPPSGVWGGGAGGGGGDGGVGAESTGMPPSGVWGSGVGGGGGVGGAGGGVGAESAGVPSGVWRARVDCSSGTYVRALVADLGCALGGGAHLRRLRRTAVGHFTLADAHPVESPVMLPAARAVSSLSGVRVGSVVATEVRHGRVLPLARLGILRSETASDADRSRHPDPGPWAVHDMRGNLLAVYEPHPRGAKPMVVVTG